MKILLLLFVFASLTWQSLYAATTLTKRQSCGSGGCGAEPITSPCFGGGCGSQPIPSPCSGGGCNSCPGGNCGTPCSGIGCTGQQPAPIRTCSSCISGCSNRCSSNQCVNNCLGSCSCDNERIVNTNTNQCCDVLHPKNCFTDDYGSRRCVVRRHRECSDLCSSSVVSLQQTEGASTGCHYIRNYPYVYCGNYERQSKFVKI